MAGVSHTTVSRALNDSPLINKETKERIRELARKLHYTPNVSARSLVLDRSYNIGLFFSTLGKGTSSGFLHDVVRGVNRRIKHRYNLVLKGIDDYDDYTAISPKNFDGIIVMSQSAKDDAFIETVLKNGIPQVVLNRRVDFAGVCNILSDDYQGAFKLVSYMIRQGHRRIALIEGKEGFHSADERAAGYTDALKAHGIDPQENVRIRGSYDLESGYEAMRQLLEKRPVPTAVFCANDDMAVGAIKAAMEKGMAVPDDISVAGFDDSLFAAYMSPALTTVTRQIEQISQLGADKLMRIIEMKDRSEPVQKIQTEVIRMEAELIVRESVAKCLQ